MKKRRNMFCGSTKQDQRPDAKSIKRRYSKFRNTESVEDLKRTGRPKQMITICYEHSVSTKS